MPKSNLFPHLDEIQTPKFIELYKQHEPSLRYDFILNGAVDESNHLDAMHAVFSVAFTLFWSAQHGFDKLDSTGISGDAIKQSLTQACPALHNFADVVKASDDKQKTLFEGIHFFERKYDANPYSEMAFAQLEVEIYQKTIIILPLIEMIKRNQQQGNPNE